MTTFWAILKSLDDNNQYNRKRIASHKRSFTAGKYVTIKDHLSSAHKFHSEWSPDFFNKLAKPLGESVQAYIRVLIESQTYPEIAYKQCLGIIHLKSSYDKKRNGNTDKIERSTTC